MDYIFVVAQVIGKSSCFCFQRKAGDFHSQGDNAEVFESIGTPHVTGCISLVESRNPLKPCSPSSALIVSFILLNYLFTFYSYYYHYFIKLKKLI